MKNKSIFFECIFGILFLIMLWQGVNVARVKSLYNKEEYAHAYELMDKVWIKSMLGNLEMKLYVLEDIDRDYRKALDKKDSTNEADKQFFETYAAYAIAECIGQSERAKEYGVEDVVEDIKWDMVSELYLRDVGVAYRLRKLKMDDSLDWYFAPLIFDDGGSELVDQLIADLK